MKAGTFLFLILISMQALARDVYVQGHVRQDGTYVAPHVRSAPDSTRVNNYGAPTPTSRTTWDRDKDYDSLYNQYDQDDDNDGIHDDYERKY